MPTRQVYDKTKASGHFFRLPTNIRHYVYVPRYKAEMNYLYALLSDYFNAEYGYAFPSIYTLALDYGKSEKTTAQHLKVLEEVGLIRRIRTAAGNRYITFEPLERDELFVKFPTAKLEHEKAIKRMAAERERALENLAELGNKIPYESEL